MARRGSLLFLVGVSAIAALVLTGCAAREAVHPLSTYVVPDFRSKAVKTVGLMPISDQTNSEVGMATVLPLLEKRAAEETAYMFLSEEEILGRSQKKGLRDNYTALVSGWKKDSKISKEDVVSVGGGSNVEALLFVEILQWTQEWVNQNTEGTSWSQVGIRTVLVSSETGAKLWEASDEQIMESAYYSPESGIGTHVDAGGMVRSSAVGGVPDPPSIEEVARRVLDALFRVFP
ncbi:MAG: hypothetical protein AMJ46_13150 [Latescibacteria bacterium DG_63]|nr:MAG: hypothetical protein AMJ46_13150 [Latescibacteria bacterium DG_63]